MSASEPIWHAFNARMAAHIVYSSDDVYQTACGLFEVSNEDWPHMMDNLWTQNTYYLGRKSSGLWKVAPSDQKRCRNCEKQVKAKERP